MMAKMIKNLKNLEAFRQNPNICVMVVAWTKSLKCLLVFTSLLKLTLSARRQKKKFLQKKELKGFKERVPSQST